MKFKNLIVYFLFSFSLFAQFGQNKVQYREHDWFYIQTKHFDIYYTDKGETTAEFTAHAAEASLESILSKLDYELGARIALIIYDSHNEFQETNTTDSYLSQGVGGFTEPFKNRVVFPFEGSYEKFEHVIHHELVHAVMRDLLYGGTVQNIIAKGITLQLPIWYHEGMAEYLASGWETNSDMFIRDAIINEYLPDINQLGGYYAYRGGQALFKYIADKYGEQKVGELLKQVQNAGNVQNGLKAGIGLTIEELNDRWKKSLKREYWPEISYRKDPDEIAKRLTDNKKVGGFYNTSPAISPQGNKIAFISDRDIFLDVYIMDVNKPDDVDKIINSGMENDFEELNVLFPSLTWAPDNKRIALSTKSGGFDRITIIDVEEGDSKELPFKFSGIESVSWSYDGNKLAFNASNESQSDIYIYDFEKDKLDNLTNDLFSDMNPSWSHDGKWVVFSSDRGEFVNRRELPKGFEIYNHDYKNIDLYAANLETEKVFRLTDWEFSAEKSGVLSPDGKYLIFVSDYNGIDNMYRKEVNGFENPEELLKIPNMPLTNSLNGINQLSTTEDGKKLVFTSLFNQGYNVYLLNNPFEMKPLGEEIPSTNYMTLIKTTGSAEGLFANSPSDEVLANQNDSISTPTLEKFSTDSANVIISENVEEQNIDTTNVKSEVETQTESDEPQIFTGQLVENSDTTKKDESYSNYIFGSKEIASDSSAQKMKDTTFIANLDDDGNFLVNKYKINFSPDLIYANAGYSTLYGLLGTTVLSFSDMLGNHRLVGITSLQVDLKNSDYGLAYYYLPGRIDYGIEGFHTARFIYINRNGGSQLFRYRNFGFIASASYPLSRFYRLEGSLSYLNVSSENLDNYNDPTEKVSYVIPSIGFVHDNTFFGYYSPIEGSRYRITLFGNPGLNSKKNSFYSAVWDFRQYYRFWFDNGFAMRFSGGYSGGSNPQRFFLGGVDNWINRSFASGDIPIESVSDFAFLTPGLPMRGYDYGEKIGTKYSLVNLELRVPLIRYLVTGPLPILFQNILGSVYFDAGTAWNDSKQLQFFEKNDKGKTVSKDLLMGTGFGIRMYFIFLWKFDFAWAYNVEGFSKPRFYLSLGTDF